MKGKVPRKKTMMFRMTEREFYLLEKAANERGMTKSEMFRLLLSHLEDPLERKP